MLKDIQNLFRQSVAAFRTELGRREPEDQVAELLSAMRREMVTARAAVAELKEQQQRAGAELERERDLLLHCERRGALAERIDDRETARVAAEFAGRHRERIGVLELRVSAVQAEHALRLRESEEMRRKYQEADANRFALVAQLRRTHVREQMQSRLGDADGPFADFARMEGAVEGRAGYADALDAVLEESPEPPAPPPADDVEERLLQLKRRMGRE